MSNKFKQFFGNALNPNDLNQMCRAIKSITVPDVKSEYVPNILDLSWATSGSGNVSLTLGQSVPINKHLSGSTASASMNPNFRFIAPWSGVFYFRLYLRRTTIVNTMYYLNGNIPLGVIPGIQGEVSRAVYLNSGSVVYPTVGGNQSIERTDSDPNIFSVFGVKPR